MAFLAVRTNIDYKAIDVGIAIDMYEQYVLDLEKEK